MITNQLNKLLLCVSLVVLAGCNNGNTSNTPEAAFNKAPAINLDYIQDCIDDSTTLNELSVDRDNYMVCHDEYLYENEWEAEFWGDFDLEQGLHGISTQFQLRKSGELITVDLGTLYFVPAAIDVRDSNGNQVRWEYDVDPELANDLSVLSELVEGKKGELTAFFKKHGIDLVVAFEYANEMHDGLDYSKTVRLSGGQGRSNKRLWFLGGDSVTNLIIHEIGHFLGLPDRYAEPSKCPARNTVVENTDIMATSKENLSESAFNHTDIRSILMPLCEPETNDYYPDIGYITPDLFFSYDEVDLMYSYDYLYPNIAFESVLRSTKAYLGINRISCSSREEYPNQCFDFANYIENGGYLDLGSSTPIHHIYLGRPTPESNSLLSLSIEIADDEGSSYKSKQYPDLDHIENAISECQLAELLNNSEPCEFGLSIYNTDFSATLTAVSIHLSDYEQKASSERNRLAPIIDKLKNLEAIQGLHIRCQSYENACLNGLDTLQLLFSDYGIETDIETIVLLDGAPGAHPYTWCKSRNQWEDNWFVGKVEHDSWNSTCFETIALNSNDSAEDMFTYFLERQEQEASQ